MNRMMTKRVIPAVVVLIGLAVAGAIGYAIARHSAATAPQTAAATPSQRKALYWYDPMKPKQHFTHPGISPMGMQLVPKYATGNSGQAPNIVRVNPAEVQNLGMRTAVVQVKRLADTVQVPGTVVWDQKLAVTVSARTNATIETLYVRAPLTTVKAGQPLAEILAPRWSAAAAQYFALRHAKSTTGRSLRAAARQRLHTLGMTDTVIRSLRRGSGTITLRAPTSGVLSKLDVQQGQQIAQGTPIARINGLDKVWVNAAIPQAQSGAITAGTPIVATVTALPGKTFHGQVDALLPEVSTATRTRRARIVLDNPEHELAPGMFVALRIAVASSAPHPLVPTEAVIATGVHTRVIVALGDGEFRPVRVKTGRSANGMLAILAGLHGGERIVTSGQFLIDSEASLSGALTRMQAGHGSSGEVERSSGAPRHLLPKGEGKKQAMPGMSMPKPSPPASSAHRRQSSMPGMTMPMPASSSGSGGRP